ncbi:MAG: hypothetical protein ACU841_10525 [Gammaproteobacteria bacterium]
MHEQPDRQRQDVPGDIPRNSASNSTPVTEFAQEQAGLSETGSLSSDDLVDKVWRKLMRKLAMEQERIGGSGRWAD